MYFFERLVVYPNKQQQFVVLAFFWANESLGARLVRNRSAFHT